MKFVMSFKWLKLDSLDSPINGRLELNFDGSRVESKSVSEWVIRDSNGTIKMIACRHLGKTSIIITECMTLRDGILVAKNNGFLSLEIEGD